MNSAITTDRLTNFLILCRQVRGMQKEYRRTIDSRLRHRLPLVEEQLDRETDQLLDVLRAAAVEAEAEQLAEGGVS